MSNKIHKISLGIFFSLMVFVLSGKSVHAKGWMPGNFFYPYIEMLSYVFIVSLFVAIVSVIAGIVGSLTGKFKISKYISIALFLIAIIALLIPFFA